MGDGAIAASPDSNLVARVTSSVTAPRFARIARPTVMSSSKRSRSKEPTTEAQQPKQRRVTNDRIEINVGGTVFTTTQATLVGNSEYFATMFSNVWRVDDDERPDIFIDRDADTFAVLLSCMRSRAVLLPESDLALCTRVLYDAEFYGMEWLLNMVKVKTVRRDMEVYHNDELRDDEERVQAFNKRFASLQDAIEEGILPSGFFTPPKKEQEGFKILSVQPVSNMNVIFEDRRSHSEVPAFALAVVEDVSGSTHVEPLVQHPHKQPDTDKLMLASAYRTADGADYLRWHMRPAPRLEALPPDSVSATVGDDNDRHSYNVPFAHVTPSADGVSLPEVTYLDVDAHGNLTDFVDYNDFKGFCSTSVINKLNAAQLDLAGRLKTGPEAFLEPLFKDRDGINKMRAMLSYDPATHDEDE